MPEVRERRSHHVGVIGHGAIGSVLASSLISGSVAGCSLTGVYAHSQVPAAYRRDSVDDVLADSTLVVEAASQAAVRDYGMAILRSGVDLLVVSVGALCDEVLLSSLKETAASTGARLLVTTGAIGAVDILRAAHMLGDLEEVRLTSVKPGRALVQDWMDADTIEALEHGDRPVVVFSGPASAAVERFPRSVNVAATLALTTVGFDGVEVEIIADPAAERVRHTIEAHGAAGTYRVAIENVPSELNVRTSAVTPHAVLRGLHDLTAGTVIGL